MPRPWWKKPVFDKPNAWWLERNINVYHQWNGPDTPYQYNNFVKTDYADDFEDWYTYGFKNIINEQYPAMTSTVDRIDGFSKWKADERRNILQNAHRYSFQRKFLKEKRLAMQNKLWRMRKYKQFMAQDKFLRNYHNK